VNTSDVNPPMESHVSDGVLLALHDEQRDAEFESGRRHVAHCVDCQARFDAIATHAKGVRGALAAISVPAGPKDELLRRVVEGQRPARRNLRRQGWLVAAAIVVLASAAAAFPIRQWMLGRRAETSTKRESPPIVAPAAQPIERSGATVSFAVTDREFTVRFDSLPAAGNLTSKRTTADQISARVAGGAGTGGDAFVVLPSELLVRNTSAAHASYEISLPSAVARLRVIVAGRVVFDGAPPATISLSQSR